MAAYPGQNVTRRRWAICAPPYGTPNHGRYDTAWKRTRACSDTSNTEIQCLTPMHHSGARGNVANSFLAYCLVEVKNTCMLWMFRNWVLRAMNVDCLKNIFTVLIMLVTSL